MALDCYVGSFSANTSTGTQSVTGVGFQPKALILWVTDQTADGSGADVQSNIGFATGSGATSQLFCANNAEDNQATSDRAAQVGNTYCCVINTAGTTTTRMRFSLSSFDADGFTISITTTDAVAYLVGFMALGGADLTNASVKSFDSATSTGNAAYTGVGFQPDCIVFAGTRIDNGPMLGVATASSQWVSISYGENGVGTSETAQYQVTTSCVGTLNASNIITLASLSSMDSDGFTLNWSNVFGTVQGSFIALCLKGGSYATGTDTQNTSTGTKATTGTGFTPGGIVLASANYTSTTSVVQQSRMSWGFASGTSNRGCIWGGSQDNVSTTVCDHDIDTAAVIKMLTEGTPTLNAEADLSSFDSNGFTLNWTTADATAREFCYLAFGDTGGGPTGPTIHQGLSRMEHGAVRSLHAIETGVA